jgi:hypothetical protein
MLMIAATTTIAAFLILQLVPGHARTNPPVRYHVEWNSPQTEKLGRTACYDCHSNETVWPWYSQIAPISWLVVRDVDEGRAKLNFSEGQELEGDEMIEKIQTGAMPPRKYLLLHPEANLNAEQKAQLIEGIRASLGAGD